MTSPLAKPKPGSATGAHQTLGGQTPTCPCVGVREGVWPVFLALGLPARSRTVRTTQTGLENPLQRAVRMPAGTGALRLGVRPALHTLRAAGPMHPHRSPATPPTTDLRDPGGSPRGSRGWRRSYCLSDPGSRSVAWMGRQTQPTGVRGRPRARASPAAPRHPMSHASPRPMPSQGHPQSCRQ